MRISVQYSYVFVFCTVLKRMMDLEVVDYCGIFFGQIQKKTIAKRVMAQSSSLSSDRAAIFAISPKKCSASLMSTVPSLSWSIVAK